MEASEIGGEPVLKKDKTSAATAKCWTIKQGSRFLLHVLDGVKDCDVCDLVWFASIKDKDLLNILHYDSWQINDGIFIVKDVPFVFGSYEYSILIFNYPNRRMTFQLVEVTFCHRNAEFYSCNWKHCSRRVCQCYSWTVGSIKNKTVAFHIFLQNQMYCFYFNYFSSLTQKAIVSDCMFKEKILFF